MFNCNFGYIYGMLAKSYVSYAKTQYGIEVTLREAELLRDRYFAKYAQLLDWHRSRELEVRKYKQVRSVFGRVRHLPQIDSSDFMTELEAVRQAINSPVQGAGSDLGLMAIARIDKELDIQYLRVKQFIHDALYSYVPLEYMAWASITLKYYMESNPIFEWFNFEFSVPIIAEPEMGMNQGSLVEVTTPTLSPDEITLESLSYIEPHMDELAEAGCILPVQKIPPNFGRKTRRGLRRLR